MADENKFLKNFCAFGRKSLCCLKKAPLVGDVVEKKNKVLSVRLSGVIAEASVKRQGIHHARFSDVIDKVFLRAEEDLSVRAIAFVINSPGGSPAQSALIGKHIRRRAEKLAEKLPEGREVRILAFVEDVAASGGYWLACAADEIYALDVSIVGSIGVISAGFGFEELIGRHGVSRRLHTSGTEKSFLDPFLPEKEEDVKRLEALQKEMHGAFIEWVKERRGEKLQGTDKKLFNGAFWTGVKAADLGLVDGMSDLHEYAELHYGADSAEGGKVKIIDMTPEKKLPFPLGLAARLGARFETGGSLPAEMVELVEEKALWQRFGV